MGSIRDTMHTFEIRDLHHLLPARDGWEESGQSAVGNGTLYRYSRVVRGSNEEHAIVLVSYDAVIPADTVSGVMQQGENGWRNSRYFLFVPQGTDTSAIEPTVQVNFMPGFGFRDGKLVWLAKKKNAKKVICDPCP